jgi:hypothetical protein
MDMGHTYDKCNFGTTSASHRQWLLLARVIWHTSAALWTCATYWFHGDTLRTWKCAGKRLCAGYRDDACSYRRFLHCVVGNLVGCDEFCRSWPRVTLRGFAGLRGVYRSADKNVLTMVFIMVTNIQRATLTGRKVRCAGDLRLKDNKLVLVQLLVAIVDQEECLRKDHPGQVFIGIFAVWYTKIE